MTEHQVRQMLWEHLPDANGLCASCPGWEWPVWSEPGRGIGIVIRGFVGGKR